MKAWKTALVAAVLGGYAFSAAAADYTYINIGTAGLGGGFYPAGGALCNMVNKTRKELGHNLRCTVEATAGSLGNLRAMKAGDLEFALVNAEWQHAAYNGGRKFKGQPMTDLRYLMAIHGDEWYVVVHPDSGIKTFNDLRGKVVNTGNVGSGTEATAYLILEEYGWDPKVVFKRETKLTSREQAQALCDGKIDAFIFPSGLPGPSVTEATSLCNAKILPWDDEVVTRFLKKYPYFAKSHIPGGTYAGHPDDIPTWGVQGTVAATTRMTEETAYYIVKSVFDNFEQFQKQSPIFLAVTREGAARNGQSAPYHPGSLKYFKEVGLVK